MLNHSRQDLGLEENSQVEEHSQAFLKVSLKFSMTSGTQMARYICEIWAIWLKIFL